MVGVEVKTMKFGVQLYSLRELAAREGAEAVLRTVAQAGYDGVEFAGFYDKTPDEMDALLKKYNLEPVSAHIGADSILPQMPYIDKLKIGNIFIPWVAKETFDDPEKFSSFCSQVTDLKDLLAKKGILFGYHNHAHEFENGQDRLERLLTALPWMKSELDVFWATVAGLDPVEYMKKLGDRLAFVHIKEAAKDALEQPQPIVGEGVVDMRGVFEEMKCGGIEWAVLEVEKYPCGEAEYLCRSLENMKKLAK